MNVFVVISKGDSYLHTKECYFSEDVNQSKSFDFTENGIVMDCPKDYLLRALSGKWKTCVFRYAIEGPIRFGQMLKLLPEATRQGMTNALRELEEKGILERKVIKEKPLHVEYTLTELGIELIPVFKVIDALNLLPVYKKPAHNPEAKLS
jgi:DNA-binding HxlR family transcriptional regulator